MSARAWVVCRKEIVDNLRDRRSVMMALFYALMGPLLLIPMLGFVGRIGERRLLTIPVEGADHAPGLVAYLHRHDIDVRPAPADPAAAVRNLEYDLVLIIPESYGADFRAGRPATVRIVTDESRSTAAGEINRVTLALASYSQTVGALRLVARGVSPNVVQAIAVETDDLATPESRAALMLASVPIFLLMALFMGGATVAVDVTAGERERGSLEALMSTPLSSAEVVLGKLGAVVAFALATFLVSLIGFAVVLTTAPFPEIPGMKFALDLGGSLRIAAAFVPLLVPAAAIEMLLASRSKTAKEAYTAVTFCMSIPVLPGIFLAFSPFKATIAMMAVPVLAQDVLVIQVMKGAPLGLRDYALAGASATALGALLAMIAVARYGRARVVGR